jgi:hypothetical protein
MDIVAGDWLVGPYGLYDRFTFFFSTDANLPYKEFRVMGEHTMKWMNQHLFLLPRSLEVDFQFRYLQVLRLRRIYSRQDECRHLMFTGVTGNQNIQYPTAIMFPFVFDEDEVSCADDDPDVEYLEDTCTAWDQVRHEVQSATGDIAADHQMSDHL